MKHLNVVASVILAAAVLLAAYAIGRLIRQSRMDKAEPEAPLVASPNDVSELPAVNPGPADSRRAKESTPEERAQIKEQKAKRLAEMDKLTDEEKRQLRDEWRAKLRSRRGKPGRVPQLSPEELQEVSKRWATMTDEEKRAFRARMEGQHRARRAQPRPARKVSSPNEPAAQEATEAGASEPNNAG